MKTTTRTIDIQAYTDDEGKPVCSGCIFGPEEFDCDYERGPSLSSSMPTATRPGPNCPIWHGESKSEWQPISTAPKDGTAILGCYWNPLLSHLYNPITIIWASYHPNAKGKECWRTSAICGDKANPTHWMPLPAPPKGDK